MYRAGKGLLLRALRVPEEPAPPEGSAGSLRVFRASRQYYRYRLLGWVLGSAWVAIVAVGALIGLSKGLAEGNAPSGVRALLFVLETIGLAGLVSSMVVSFLTLRLDWEMRWYMVTDRSLRIREGVWHVHEMTMTFANIQNISISQGPLQRLFGIADLRVQSAGGGGSVQPEPKGGSGAVRDLHVGWFKGVDDAPAIRDLVLERLRLLRDAGLGDHDDLPRAAATPGTRAPMPADLVAALQELRRETSLLRAAAER